MLEAEKPFMFASSSTGRPATANDLNLAASATSAEASVNTNNGASSNASALPRMLPPQQKSQSQQEGPSQPTPPPPPPPQGTTTTTLPPDQRITLPPTTVPPPTPYYHPHHYHHHQLHQHQHHHHHSAPAVSAPPPSVAKEEEGYHYHQHPAPGPAAYGRQHHERDSAYTYRPATTSSGLLNAGAEVYIHQSQQQQQRRQQQQQQQPQQQGQQQQHQHHHHHTHHTPPAPHQHHTGTQYHVHHLHQHIPQQTHTSVVPEEQSYYGAGAAAAGGNGVNGAYLNEMDDSDAWFDGQSDGAAESRRAKKKKEYTVRIERINADFMDNRERIYAEKIAEIQQEMKMVHDGTHVAFLEGVAELEYIRRKTIEDGRLFRDYQDRVTDRQFDQEIALAEEEYMNEKKGVREKLFATLEEKRKKLKEDKDNCELSYDALMESQARILKRNLRRRGPDHNDNKANKRKQMSDARPGLIFKLKEDDIQSDFEEMCIGSSYSYTMSYSSKKTVGVSRKK